MWAPFGCSSIPFDDSHGRLINVMGPISILSQNPQWPFYPCENLSVPLYGADGLQEHGLHAVRPMTLPGLQLAGHLPRHEPGISLGHQDPVLSNRSTFLLQEAHASLRTQKLITSALLSHEPPQAIPWIAQRSVVEPLYSVTNNVPYVFCSSNPAFPTPVTAEPSTASAPIPTSSEAEEVKKVPSIRCQVCGKQFHFRSSLNRHQLVHSDSKPYTCPHADCGYRFHDPSNAKRHELIHACSKYSCPEQACGCTFNHVRSLRSHLRKSHRWDDNRLSSYEHDSLNQELSSFPESIMHK